MLPMAYGEYRSGACSRPPRTEPQPESSYRFREKKRGEDQMILVPSNR